MPVSSQQNQNRWNAALRVNVERTGGGSYFRPKNGENLMRVMNFQHKVTKGDIQLGRYSPADAPIGSMQDEFFLPTRRHFRGKGQPPTPCGRLYKIDGSYDGSCVSCDQADDLRNSELEADRKAADRIKPAVAYAMNIVDLSGTEQKIIVWEAPYGMLEFIQKSRDSTAYRNQEMLGLGGRDILVTYRAGDGVLPRDRYQFLWMDRDQAKKISAKGEVIDLYGSPNYVPSQFAGLLTAAPQTAVKAQEPSAPAKAPAVGPTGPKPGKGSVAPVEEVQEEIPVEEKPAPKKVTKKKAEPSVAVKYRVGSKVKFIAEDDEQNPVELEGEIVAEGETAGTWNVLAGDDEYGCTEEEFIK